MKQPRTGAGRIGWHAATAIVRVAALAMTGWSLYTVARHYGTPTWTAVSSAAVFDGIAVAALHLASEASASGRSAAGARLTGALMAGVSVYLNTVHAGLARGGVPAAVLFSAPTVGMLLLSELSWAGPRATEREARGQIPFRLPTFGGWAWFLAPRLAARTVKARARLFIDPDWTPKPPKAELAADVPGFTVDRPDTSAAPAEPLPAEPVRPALTSTAIPADLSEYRPDSFADGVRQLLDRGITDKTTVVTTVTGWMGCPDKTDSVRKAYERETDKRTRQVAGDVGRGGGGYA